MAKTISDLETKRQLIDRLARLTADQPAKWGAMSAHQAICHLADSTRLPLGERAVEKIEMRAPKAFLKFVVLTLPLPWPKNLSTGGSMKQGGGGTEPIEFEADRDDLADIIERLTAKPPNSDWPDHPALGPLTPAQWFRWAWLHADHHLRQFGR